MKRRAKRATPHKSQPDVKWVIGLVAGDRRAKSYEVAHAMLEAEAAVLSAVMLDDKENVVASARIVQEYWRHP